MCLRSEGEIKLNRRPSGAASAAGSYCRTLHMRPAALWHRTRHLKTLIPGGASVLPFSSSTCFSFPRSSPVRTEGGTVQRLSAASGSLPEDGCGPGIEGRSKRKLTRSSKVPSETPDSPLLPNGVDHGTSDPSGSFEQSGAVGLPPPWLLQEAYENLLLTLHPQIQHRAAYSSGDGGSVEPTLSLYCPIEGGEYVIDATVREIASRARADVVVIDALDLAAGEHGKYGKSASIINFHSNPLHHSPTPTLIGRQLWARNEKDEEIDGEGMGLPFIFGEPQSFTIQIPVGVQSTSFRAARGTPSGASIVPLARHGPSQQTKAFFHEIINIDQPVPICSASVDKAEASSARPRLIYIKDFPLIASQFSSWYPALLGAVRTRRQNGNPRSSLPISQPTTIVFGITPPLIGPSRPSSKLPSSQSVVSVLTGNSLTSTKLPRPESWSEGDSKSRERRLRERLRKWQKGDDWLSELPHFGGTSLPHKYPRVLRADSSLLGSDNILSIPTGSSPRASLDPVAANKNGYFRVVGVVPASRDPTMEATGRFSRRLHYNEMAFKMAVADAGGSLQGHIALPTSDPTKVESSLSALTVAWTQSLEPWKILKAAADAVVASRLGVLGVQRTESLDLVTITWSDVERTIISEADAQQLRKDWIESSASALVDEEKADVDAVREESTNDVDEILESVKRDPDLDQHEQRLLGCIVDSATMPTTFKSVHLPPATVDSVRTIVSLPLLHPEAFATGILKTHSMNGVLLFGPPGTGKTLLARAICKESGARMMLIKPSDVMDMYVGEGEKLVRSVFTLARRLSPCVVFLDEIDALFGHRVSSRDGGSAMAHRGVITEFMQEMDGLKSSRDQSVIVIGATNRPFDLDDAVLRRLPRRLLIDLPGPTEREEILKILLRDETLSRDVDLGALAKRTDAFSGSDLKHLCIAAALDAVKENVDVPWAVPSRSPTPATKFENDQLVPDMKTIGPPHNAQGIDPKEQHLLSRTLSLRHFNKALREITPSASEALGTLVAIRKWNEEFGEGSKGRRRRAWGDRFGFSAIGATTSDSTELNTVEPHQSI
ncbi:uncharacterized protein EI90DRAFT_3027608 [Cantharellus anzutake]|uniref:uncharacterized protein n=1 Tax=Cantharellus anzutake TaxID=1750568 RepID=UPI001907AA40|nr:uncharacterized protein EI90DRAFT_3027608 [Cantharellus anzutake]KAF8343940.1 hypothetical protein EI90DRAFT_3027608 [Cantharellus anzutake]